MEIKTYEIPEDIVTLSVTAVKFPEGVKDAFKALASTVPDFNKRRMYGVSEQINGGLLYKACVDQNSPAEAEKFHVDSSTIPKGTYLLLTLNDWQEHMDLFPQYFEQLLKHPNAKKNSIGVEIYESSKEVLLLVERERA